METATMSAAMTQIILNLKVENTFIIFLSTTGKLFHIISFREHFCILMAIFSDPF